MDKLHPRDIDEVFAYGLPCPVEVRCADDFLSSVFAWPGASCTPDPGAGSFGPWATVEVGYPAWTPAPWPDWLRHAEIPSRPCESLYRDVPVNLVRSLIAAHGGAVELTARPYPRERAELAGVIAIVLNTMTPGLWQATLAYAEGMVTGRINAVVSVDGDETWEYVPRKLGYTIFGACTDLDGEWGPPLDDWLEGIRLVHGLGHGVLEHEDTGERCGVESALRGCWFVDEESLDARNLTLDAVARACPGDVMEAARTVLAARASLRMP